MNHLANVYLWDTLVGAVSLREGEREGIGRQLA